ncbi:MAG: galactofuranose transport system substrate-binding protein [Verrucomicrobiota bacterium]
MKRLLGWFAVFSFMVCASAAFAAGPVWPAREKVFVGFSQADLKSTWRSVENDDMKAEAAKRGFKFAMTNAEGDTAKQISDIESLLAQGVNVLVIVPIDAEAIKPALEEAKDKGVPVILKARGANGVAGVDYVTGIMSDFVWEGNQAGKWISAAAKKKGLQKVRVIEIQGVIGGTDVRDRGQGFQNAADEAGNFEFVATQSADWSRSKAQELVQNLIQSKGKDGFDAIYAQNDEMALGAGLALQQAGLTVNKDVFLVGVDGMKEAFDAIKSGKFSASVTCTPKFAGQVFDAIEAGIAGKPIPGSIAVHDALVDQTNVEAVYDLGF